MKDLLIATHNKAKIAELTAGFQPLTTHGYVIHTLREFAGVSEPEETGKTFEENSLLKARYYAKHCGMPAIGDDGGLTIDALDGAPGVYSRRWAGPESTDEELIAYTLQQMEQIPDSRRSAQMQTCLCYYDPVTNNHLTVTERVSGHITRDFNPHWTRGYPYRAVFNVDQFNKYYDDLSPAEHAQINHRHIAIGKLTDLILHTSA